ncbi:MAG: hypothetical protein K2N85_02425, partial [Lachnospiraceae bacterium]|nr:hypothetical protein [Lachnospiraceae bacterium]
MISLAGRSLRQNDCYYLILKHWIRERNAMNTH